MELTPRQSAVLAAIREYTKQHGHAPSFRDLMRELGIRSPNGVLSHLKALARKGVVTWTPGVSRSIRIVGESPVAVLEWVSRDGGFAGLSPETRDAVLLVLGSGTIC